MDITNVPQALAEPGVWGAVLSFCVGVTVAVGVISIVFELMAVVALLTPSEKDDKWVGKILKKWVVIKPLFELFHIKTPILGMLNKVLERIKKLRKIVEDRKAKK